MTLANSGVFICTHKKLVDMSRHLVQTLIVSLLTMRDHQLRLNEPKIATEGSLRAQKYKTRLGMTLGRDR